MSELYANLLRATNNLNDIIYPRIATIVNRDDCYYTVLEEENGLYHQQVQAVNSVSVGDKVVLLFLNNSLYQPIILGAISTGDDEGYVTRTEFYNVIGGAISYINE